MFAGITVRACTNSMQQRVYMRVNEYYSHRGVVKLLIYNYSQSLRES